MEMPRTMRSVRLVRNFTERTNDHSRAATRTIEQYYLSRKCIVCSALSRDGLCSRCSANPGVGYLHVIQEIASAEKQLRHIQEICHHCTGDIQHDIECDSLDCEVLYERVKLAQRLSSYKEAPAVKALLQAASSTIETTGR